MDKNMILQIKENYLMYQDQFMTITTRIPYHISAQINTRLYQDFTINMTSGNTLAMVVWIMISMVEKEKDQVHI
jgi:hypothetical protein